MKQAFKQLFSNKRVGLPIILFVFLSVFILPFSSSLITGYGRKQTNKYDFLLDDVAYVVMDEEDYADTKSHFSPDHVATFLSEVRSDEKGYYLAIYSSFDVRRFGAPYLEGSFFSLPGSFSPEAGCFYSIGFNNSENDSGPLGFSEYRYGGQLESMLPHLSPFDDAPAIDRVLVFVTDESLFSKATYLTCCFECDDALQASLFEKTSIGRNIKANYAESMESYLSTIRTLSFVPITVLLPMMMVLARFLSASQRRNWSIQYLFSTKKRYLFRECAAFWALAVILPCAIAVCVYAIFGVSLGLPLYYPYLILLSASVVFIGLGGALHDFLCARKGAALL